MFEDVLRLTSESEDRLKQIRQLESELNGAQMARDFFKSVLDGTNEDLRKAESELAQVHFEIEAKDENYDSLYNRYCELKENAQAFQDHLAQARKDANYYRGMFEQECEQTLRLKANLTGAKQKLAVQSDNLKAQQQEIEQLRGDNHDMSHQIGSLQKALEESESQNRIQGNWRADLHSAHVDLFNEHHAVSQAYEDLAADRLRVLDELKLVRAERDRYREQCDSMVSISWGSPTNSAFEREAIPPRNPTIARVLSTKIEDLEAENKAYAECLHQLRDKCEALQMRNDNQFEAIKGLTAENEALSAKIKELTLPTVTTHAYGNSDHIADAFTTFTNSPYYIKPEFGVKLDEHIEPAKDTIRYGTTMRDPGKSIYGLGMDAAVIASWRSIRSRAYPSG